MTWSRRQLLQAAAAGAAAALCPVAPRRAVATGRTAPTKLVHVFLRGGFDAILTTDPKVGKDVDATIDIPYAANQIIDVGGARVGPLFAGMKQHVPAMAMLNGVDNGTVGHGTGLNRILTMKKHYPIRRGLATSMTGALGGLLSHGMPLDDVWMVPAGPARPEVLPARRGLRLDGWSPTKKSFLERLWEGANENAAYPVLEHALRDELADCRGRGTEAECGPLADTHALFERLRGLPRPEPVTALDLHTDEVAMERLVVQAAHEWAEMTRDLVYLLRHDLAPCVFFIAPHSFWDSHQENLVRQTACASVFTAGFSHLVKALDLASLSNETALVISSELGRFPVLNGGLGKDHFPQHPFILMGPGIRPGQYGSTDRRMIALPLDERTGHAGSGRVPTLDDVGATVFRWFGFDGAPLGYRGHALPFLIS